MIKHRVSKKLVVTILAASLSFHSVQVSASFSSFYPSSSMYESMFLPGSYSRGFGLDDGLDVFGSQTTALLCEEKVKKPLKALVERLIKEKVFFVSTEEPGVFWVFDDVKNLAETLVEIRNFVRLTEDLANSNTMFFGLFQGISAKIDGAAEKIKKITEDLEKKSLLKPSEDDIRMRKCKKFELKDIMDLSDDKV